MSLKPEGTRPAFGDRDTNPYIVEAETSFGEFSFATYMEFGVTTLIEFTSSGEDETQTESTLNLTTLSISSKGDNTTESFANLGFLLTLSSSGENETNTDAVLDTYRSLIGSGSNNTETVGTVNLTFGFSAKGLSSTEDSGLVSIIKNAVAEGLGEGNALNSEFSFPKSFSSSGKSIGEGSSDLKILEIDQDQEVEKSNSFFIGSVEIPLLISKDMSVDRETIVKDFVNADSEYFQESNDFESGSYSAILNQEHHSQDKSLKEQADKVRNLVTNHPEENKIDYAGGEAYLAIESVGDVIDVNEETKEVEMNVILLEDL